MTQHFIQDVETDGPGAKPRSVERYTYKNVIRARDKLNLPFEVIKKYRDGEAMHLLRKLPKPAGWLPNEHGGELT